MNRPRALLTRGALLFELHRDGRVSVPRAEGAPVVHPDLRSFLAAAAAERPRS